MIISAVFFYFFSFVKQYFFLQFFQFHHGIKLKRYEQGIQFKWELFCRTKTKPKNKCNLCSYRNMKR